jgi:uncharacterized membrane protein YdfJ with MMPL/SSD domain
MAMSSTGKLIQVLENGQTQMLEYLKRADERGERQMQATLAALGAIQGSLQTMQNTLQAMQNTLQVMQGTQQTMQGSLQTMQGSLQHISDVQRDVALLTQEALKASCESSERAAQILAQVRSN